jgi:hypothetical protein
MQGTDMNTAQNSTKTARGRPFKPGQSGNPGGRPKGLASLVREQTGDGKELVELTLKIMRGELTVTRRTKAGIAYEQTPSHKDRMAAVEWLADRGWGKPVETHEFSGIEREIVLVPVTIDPKEVTGEREPKLNLDVENNAKTTGA